MKDCAVCLDKYTIIAQHVGASYSLKLATQYNNITAVLGLVLKMNATQL